MQCLGCAPCTESSINLLPNGGDFLSLQRVKEAECEIISTVNFLLLVNLVALGSSESSPGWNGGGRPLPPP